MPPSLMVTPLPEESSSVPSPLSSGGVSWPENRRFGDLRGLQWRMSLGVLPSSSSIDDLRRATADSRRRYASLRGRLLVDPHIPKDGSSPPNLVMDNPLSQNPDSTWSRFFRNAELERMVDQDLSRLYPEHGSYFQTAGCQGLLRRILLIWCLRHPECSYRQGMHELLAPLLYVLQVDVECLSEIRKTYEDHFTDRFDGLFCQENDLPYSFDFRKSSDSEDEIGYSGNGSKIKSLDELDPKIQAIVLLGDAYGAEGELGVVLSEKFMEHDAYCMFDALMNGAHGSVAMADFFSYSSVAGSHTGLPPVIEASTALYHLLSHADSSLHSHLVDLGVEPQYFALRWLRVLFGREFSLDNLLIIWDEIFLSDNSKVEKHTDNNTDSGFMILHSSRGAFISAMAVAMLLHLRSSLLATENPTICLQRLLNFPENTNIKKLLEKAKSLQALALSTDISSSAPSFVGFHNRGKSSITRSITLPSESVSPKTPLNLLTDSYWEEMWRVAHMDEELKQDGVENKVPTQKKRWTEKVKFSLKRAESDPSSSKIKGGKKESKETIKRSLLEDLSKELDSHEDTENLHCHDIICQQDNRSEAGEVEQKYLQSHDIICQQDNLSVAGEVEQQNLHSHDIICEQGNCSVAGEVEQQNLQSHDIICQQDNRSVASEVGQQNLHCHRDIICQQDNHSVAGEVKQQDDSSKGSNNCFAEDRGLRVNTGREENSSILSGPASPANGAYDRRNDSEKSSVGSNLSLDEINEISESSPIDSPLPVSDHPENFSQMSGRNNDSTGNSAAQSKERKLNKFQWFWRLGRNNGEPLSGKGGGASEAVKPANCDNQSNVIPSSPADGHCSSVSCKGDSVEQNVTGTLRNIGQSMLEHIQMIESAFQQDQGQGASVDNLSKNVVVGKGQVTAMTALKELRKISNLLSEM